MVRWGVVDADGDEESVMLTMEVGFAESTAEVVRRFQDGREISAGRESRVMSLEL